MPIGFGKQILLSTFLDREGEEIEGVLDLRGNEGVILGEAVALEARRPGARRLSRRDGRETASRRMAGLARHVGIDVAALQQIIEAADSGTSDSRRLPAAACACRAGRRGCDLRSGD